MDGDIHDLLFLISVNGHLLGSEWAISEAEARELAAQDYDEDVKRLVVRAGWPVQQEDEDE